MEFNPGDTIVKIGETRTYTVLRATSEWYELFWNGFGLSQGFPSDYVEENFVLIETAFEAAHGVCGDDEDDDGY